MAHGKSIRLFLIEGESSGRWKCELSNWTGLAYKIPRSMLSKCSDRTDLGYAGVYFLIGKSDDQVKDKVYIGESEDVLYRLNQHVQAGEKEWQDWSDCVVFISKDNQLNKAMIKYLESSLYDLAITADRAEVTNGNHPKKSSLSELDSAEMEEYLEDYFPLDRKYSEFPSEGIYVTAAYSIGKAYLYQLEETIGREEFHAILREYVRRNAFTNATTDDLLEVIYEYAGTDNEELNEFLELGLARAK